MSDSTERLGELLVRLKILNDHQVEKILEYQKKTSGSAFWSNSSKVKLSHRREATWIFIV